MLWCVRRRNFFHLFLRVVDISVFGCPVRVSSGFVIMMALTASLMAAVEASWAIFLVSAAAGINNHC